MFLHNKKGETIANFFKASKGLRLSDMWWHDDIPPPVPRSVPRNYTFGLMKRGKLSPNFILEPPRGLRLSDT